MMFKNLAVYRLPKSAACDLSAIESKLAVRPLLAVSPGDSQTAGWVPPRAGGAMVHVVNQQGLLALGIEQKLLPASVVKAEAAEIAARIEQSEGRRVGRKEMRELREQATLSLLPRAFVRRRMSFGWIDPVNGWLVVDASTSSKAEEFLAALRKAVEGFPVSLLKVEVSPAAAMTRWLLDGDAPPGFTLDRDLELRSAEHAEVRYVKHTLEGDAIREYIAEGKIATRLAMTWNDRISFVLTDTLLIKRLSFLDIVKEQVDGQAESAEERFDLDFALMTGEVSRMLDDIVAALGGEVAA